MKDMQQMIPLDEWQRMRDAIENCPWEAIMVKGEPVYLTREEYNTMKEAELTADIMRMRGLIRGGRWEEVISMTHLNWRLMP